MAMCSHMTASHGHVYVTASSGHVHITASSGHACAVMYTTGSHGHICSPVTQKLIRVKSDPAGSLLVAIIDPAGSHLAAKSDPPLQKVIRVQILVDSSLF